MLEFLTWLEGSALGEALRGLGIWTYGILNLGHIVGISLLFGAVVLLDLRLLGLWRDLPLPAVSRLTVPVAVVGFVLAALSGASMLTFNASEYYGNPFMLIKFPAVGVGLLNVLVVSRLPAWRERARRPASAAERRQLVVAGGVSVLAWTTAVAAGRMIGYW